MYMADRVDAILQETTTTKYKAFCPNCKKLVASWTDEIITEEVECEACDLIVEYSVKPNLHGAKLELTVKSCPGLELSSQIKQYVRLKKDGTYEFSSGNPPLKHNDVAIFDCEDSINADLAKEFFK